MRKWKAPAQTPAVQGGAGAGDAGEFDLRGAGSAAITPGGEDCALNGLIYSNLVASCRWQSQEHLERVITKPGQYYVLWGILINSHQPLEAGQGTQHHNTDGQAIPQPRESDVAIDSGHRCHGTLAS